MYNESVVSFNTIPYLNTPNPLFVKTIYGILKQHLGKRIRNSFFHTTSQLSILFLFCISLAFDNIFHSHWIFAAINNLQLVFFTKSSRVSSFLLLLNSLLYSLLIYFICFEFFFILRSMCGYILVAYTVKLHVFLGQSIMQYLYAVINFCLEEV